VSTEDIQKRYSNTIEYVIAEARFSHSRAIVTAEDGAEVYAYPHRDGTAWGVNAAESGINILRGIRRPDGTDMAVS
jgi:hypothetical protein